MKLQTLILFLGIFLAQFLVIQDHVDAQTGKPQQADVSVTFIEMLPRYNSYCVQYVNNLPSLCAGTVNQKMRPSVGEQMTLRAHVKNIGTVTSQQISYTWQIDSVTSGSIATTIAPNKEIVIEKMFPWKNENQQVTFTVVPHSSEVTAANNTRTFGTMDLTLAYFAERTGYEAFQGVLNMAGSYSLEDWVQAHIDRFNQSLRDSTYPFVPNGIPLHVRIDNFFVYDEVDGNVNYNVDRYFYDGRWRSTDGDSTNQKTRDGFWDTYISKFATEYDWGWIHEVSHQLGAIDLYRMNFKNDPAQNDGIQITKLDGTLVKTTDFPYRDIVFEPLTTGIMVGGDARPHTPANHYFSSHTAAGLNSSASFRRGFYGEYLYDVPAKVNVLITTSSGSALPFAELKLFQKDPLTEVIDNQAEITVTTNKDGIAILPNRDAPYYDTVTGHSLHPNPFGQIYVTGTNGMMVAQVRYGNKEGFATFTLHDLNIAYWQGDTAETTIAIKTSYQEPVPTATPTPVAQNGCPLIEDVNCSGVVNALDVSAVLSRFGSGDKTADIDGSGVVNAIDVTLVLRAFGSRW